MLTPQVFSGDQRCGSYCLQLRSRPWCSCAPPAWADTQLKASIKKIVTLAPPNWYTRYYFSYFRLPKKLLGTANLTGYPCPSNIFHYAENPLLSSPPVSQSPAFCALSIMKTSPCHFPAVCHIAGTLFPATIYLYMDGMIIKPSWFNVTKYSIFR